LEDSSVQDLVEEGSRYLPEEDSLLLRPEQLIVGDGLQLLEGDLQ